jgi:cobalt-zinc-cadmium efflux system protein
LHPHPQRPRTAKLLKWSLFLTIVFVGVEVIGAIKSGSLALLSDAGHNVTDSLALMLAWFGFYLQGKPADEVKTYGYHRAGVLAAFVNAIVLLALCAWILYESWQRLLAPQPVDEVIMIGVAAAGMGVNGLIMYWLRPASRHDVNIRSAFIHMLGDFLGSLAIIVGAVGIRYTGWLQIDPLLSAGIAMLIVWAAWDILKETLNILLEGLPRGLSLKQVMGALEEIDGVLDVHDLHIWSLGSSVHALSCHVLIADVPVSESNATLKRINRLLAERFHIHHTTIQFEHTACGLAGNGCVIPADGMHPHGH